MLPIYSLFVMDAYSLYADLEYCKLFILTHYHNSTNNVTTSEGTLLPQDAMCYCVWCNAIETIEYFISKKQKNN